MKDKLNKIATYLTKLGYTVVANELRKKRFTENAMVTQFINSKLQLKAEQWDKIRVYLNEGENCW